MKSNLVFHRSNENEESWLIAPKKIVLFHILWVIFFCGNGFIQLYHLACRTGKAKGCLLVYLSSHIYKSYENSRRFVILEISERQIVMKSPLVV